MSWRGYICSSCSVGGEECNDDRSVSRSRWFAAGQINRSPVRHFTVTSWRRHSLLQPEETLLTLSCALPIGSPVYKVCLYSTSKHSFQRTSWVNDASDGSDSTLPQEAQTQQPLYRITVQLDLNPFLPVSYMTRCGVEDGELVGKFGFVVYLSSWHFWLAIQIYA